MSNMEGDRAETAQQQQKGPEAYLSGEERKQVSRVFGFPEEFPAKYKSWLTDYLSVNFPEIPITQISGFEKYLYKRGTELPANPKDGQRYTYIADATNGISWEFRYNESSASQYKWEFAGGAPVQVAASASVSVTSGSYSDLGGPGVTLPLAGDYYCTWGAQISNSIAGRDTFIGLGLSTGTVDGNNALGTEALGTRIAMTRSSIKNVATAGGTLSMYYRIATEDCTAYFRDRYLVVQPVRVKKT